MITLKERTIWPSHTQPNHIYFLDDSKTKMFGYVKEGTKEPIVFSKPMGFSIRGRQFDQIPNTFGFSDPKTRTKEWKVKGSKDNVYIIKEGKNGLECSCPGFTYRHNCKHIEELKCKQH